MISNVQCHHCQGLAELVNGSVIYPRRPDLEKLHFWLCRKCKAYVGCHKNSPHHAPLGKLANEQERHWRQIAHRFFDPIWKSERMKRREAYQWLSEKLGIPFHECHISWFTAEMCKKVFEVCQNESSEIRKGKVNERQTQRV